MINFYTPQILTARFEPRLFSVFKKIQQNINLVAQWITNYPL